MANTKRKETRWSLAAVTANIMKWIILIICFSGVFITTVGGTKRTQSLLMDDDGYRRLNENGGKFVIFFSLIRVENLYFGIGGDFLL